MLKFNQLYCINEQLKPYRTTNAQKRLLSVRHLSSHRSSYITALANDIFFTFRLAAKYQTFLQRDFRLFFQICLQFQASQNLYLHKKQENVHCAESEGLLANILDSNYGCTLLLYNRKKSKWPGLQSNVSLGLP